MRAPPPLLCAISDRHRLAGSADRVLAWIGECVEAGVDLIQVREPDLAAAPLLDLVMRAVALARGSRTRILVNDRLDVALAAGAQGVHLRGSSFDAPRVRAIVGASPFPFLIGRSVHGVDEAVAAEAQGGLDYLILGTMFATSSKPVGHTLAGVDMLRAAVGACRLPILAIGGITLEQVPAMAAAGAAGVAAIGLFSGAAAPGGAAGRALRTTVADIRRAFGDLR